MQILVVGAVRRYGVSKKGEGSPYDFCVLHVLKPVSLEGTEHMKADGYGLEPAEIRCDPRVLDQVKQFQFPARLELTIDNEMGRFGQLQAICTAAKLAPALRAASAG